MSWKLRQPGAVLDRTMTPLRLPLTSGPPQCAFGLTECHAEKHLHSRRARAQPQEYRRGDSARHADGASPACPARASPRSPSTRSMPRASGAMSKSLSAYARQFLELMQKPDVDHIEGLSPAISIEQKTTSRNPRSTVGTVTEIYDYLRLLFARVGVPYSPATGLPIESQTVSQMADRILALARRHAAVPARADRARPQGRVPQGTRRAPEEGLPARQGRRQVLRHRRDCPRSTRNSSTTSKSWSTASW